MRMQENGNPYTIDLHGLSQREERLNAKNVCVYFSKFVSRHISGRLARARVREIERDVKKLLTEVLL